MTQKLRGKNDNRTLESFYLTLSKGIECQLVYINESKLISIKLCFSSLSFELALPMFVTIAEDLKCSFKF